MNFGSLAFRPKTGLTPAERDKVKAAAEPKAIGYVERTERRFQKVPKYDGTVDTNVLEASQELFEVKASEGLSHSKKSKRRQASNGHSKLQEIAQDAGNIQEITQAHNHSRGSRKRRLSESEDTSKCFDLEVQFMDRPYGSRLAPSLIIRISDDFSLYGVLSTLLVLHYDHFAASRIDPENVWLVGLFLPAKDSEAVPGEQALVEEIDIEDNAEDIKKIWERFLAECMINSREMAREKKFVGLQESKRTKMRHEVESGEMDAKSVGNTTGTAPKPAGPMIRLHLNV